MFRPTELQVSLKALRENYRHLKSLTGNNFFCPMVKANAYGHGVIPVVEALMDEACSHFGVALFEEALEIRRSGIELPGLLVFAPMVPGGLDLVSEYDITPVLLSSGDWSILKGYDGPTRPLHLKLNCGMNRLGFSESVAEELIREINNHPSWELRGLCTHFPKGEDVGSENSETLNQLKRFLGWSSQFPVEYRHALNSASLLGLAEAGHNDILQQVGARPGIALYGGTSQPGLKPLLTLTSSVQHLQHLKKGDRVSYMGQWAAPRDSIIGIIPLGYADGLRRGLSGKISVRLDSTTCPLVGAICMDYVMVDLTEHPELQRCGREVQFSLGSEGEYFVHTWAQELNTITYEIMTGFSSRLPRSYR